MSFKDMDKKYKPNALCAIRYEMLGANMKWWSSS